MQYWDETKWVVVAAPTDPNVTFLLSFINGQPSWIPHVANYRVGDSGPGGGIVFYVTDNGVHGLEAAPADQTILGLSWYCGLSAVKTDTAVFTGATNTTAIIAGVSSSKDGCAAKAAANYQYRNYSDWHLPSLDELLLLYNRQSIVGGFSGGKYWSSSDSLDSNSRHRRPYGVWFSDGTLDYHENEYALRLVRAVRAF
jgi:hypothetical protein